MQTTNDDRLVEIVVAAAQSNLALNIGRLRDEELCRQQSRDVAAGIYSVVVGRNKYGYYVRPQTNLMNCGQRISGNYPTEAEADQWARDYVAQDPARRSYVRWEGEGIGRRHPVVICGRGTEGAAR